MGAFLRKNIRPKGQRRTKLPDGLTEFSPTHYMLDSIYEELSKIRQRLDTISIQQQLMIREFELVTGRRLPAKLSYKSTLKPRKVRKVRTAKGRKR